MVLLLEAGHDEERSTGAPGLRHQRVPRDEDAAFAGTGVKTQEHTEGVELDCLSITTAHSCKRLNITQFSFGFTYQWTNWGCLPFHAYIGVVCKEP